MKHLGKEPQSLFEEKEGYRQRMGKVAKEWF